MYEDSLGKVAQEFGPLSTNVEKRLRQIDDDIRFFLNRLRESRMDRHVSYMQDGQMAKSRYKITFVYILHLNCPGGR